MAEIRFLNIKRKDYFDELFKILISKCDYHLHAAAQQDCPSKRDGRCYLIEPE